jgi:hypothetical protein
MLSGVFGYAFSMVKDIPKEIIHGVLPVKKLPDEDTRRAQAKATTGVGVEQYSPVIELLPEHDVRVGYGLVTVVQGSILPFGLSLQYECQESRGFGSVFVCCRLS